MAKKPAPLRVWYYRRWSSLCRICKKALLTDQEFWAPTLEDALAHLSEEHKDRMASGGV